LLEAPADESQDLGAMLLADLRDLLGMQPEDRKAIHSERIVEYLTKLEDRPWPTCRRGQPITQHWLARRLKPFKIGPPRAVEISGIQLRGYDLAPIREAIERYLPALSESPVNPSTASTRQPDDSRDATSGPEGTSNGRVDTSDTSPEGARNGHPCESVSPQDEAAIYVKRLVRDGMDRDEAERVAYEFVGIPVPVAGVRQ
jgi:hypothetical protein